MNSLPKDPVMLLSVVNTALRDTYPDLEAFCEAKEADKQNIIDTLSKIDYVYNPELNKFV